jgi:hypothetical protein
MVLFQHSAHLVLKTPLMVMRLLAINVTDQVPKMMRTDREQSIPTLPRKPNRSLLFHPGRRAGLQLRNHLGRTLRRPQLQGQMHMVGNTTGTEAFTSKMPCRSRQICVERRHNLSLDQRGASLRTEHHMHKIKAQGLCHRPDYMPGLQPSPNSTYPYLGLRPRLLCNGPSVLPRRSL